MMNIKQTICIAALSALALTAVAGEVNESNVTTFQANTPSLAAEVNTSLNALIVAINDNSARLDALEAAADAVTSSVSGRSYVFFELEAEVGGNNGTGSSNMLLFGSQTPITFNTDNTGFVTDTGVDSELTTFFDGGLNQLQYNFLNEAEAGVENFTWSQTGQDVTLNFPDTGDGAESVSLKISMDGSIGLKAEQDNYGSVGVGFFGGSADLGVAVRVQ